MVQLAFENKWSEIDQLSLLYDDLRLPKSLENFQLNYLTDEQVDIFAGEIVRDKTLVNSGYPVSQKGLYQAMISLENAVKVKSNR